MRPGPKTAALVVMGLLAGVSIAWAASGRERHPAIYPPQTLPIRFDHQVHLEAGADCATCHDPARKSQRSQDRNLPKHPECETCHDIESAAQGKKVDPASDCQTCHVGFDRTAQKLPARLELPTPNLKFNHQLHVDKKVKCDVCHGQMTKVALATRDQLPKMATCLACHDGVVASGECGTCHLQQPGGRLQLSFASGLLRPMQGDPFGMDHGPRFEFNHATRAGADRALCLECHAESECQSCHDGLQKPLSVHPNDFILLHAVQARVDATRCESCHRHQSFCAACHERVGVGMNAASALRPGNAKVHPNYQEFVVVPGPNHHGILASRDLMQCISCHREETCTRCHANADRGGSGSFNPHPDGYAQACRALAAKNDRACLKCHTEATLVAKGCR